MRNFPAATDSVEAMVTIDSIERVIHEEVGRNVRALFYATRGELWRASKSLSSHAAPKVGLITGFFVPAANCAETDGPVGTALLVRGLTKAGIDCRVATDDPCALACQAALAGADLCKSVPLDSAAVNDPHALKEIINTWRSEAITHVISIERCGKSADDTYRSMQGFDVSAHTAPLDTLFLGGPWDTIAVGDGGNEIGMGFIRPRSWITHHVPQGEKIACVTRADYLIVAGVSNWGAYALLGALATLREDWRAAMLVCLDPEVDGKIVDSMLRSGLAVDGVTWQATPTVDGLPLAKHHQKINEIRDRIHLGRAPCSV